VRLYIVDAQGNQTTNVVNLNGKGTMMHVALMCVEWYNLSGTANSLRNAPLILA